MPAVVADPPAEDTTDEVLGCEGWEGLVRVGVVPRPYHLSCFAQPDTSGGALKLANVQLHDIAPWLSPDKTVRARAALRALLSR